MGDLRAGCSLVVTVYVSGLSALIQSHVITGHFCTPQKACVHVGMYSRCDYLLFVYCLILSSLLHSSILFNCYTSESNFLLWNTPGSDNAVTVALG